VLLAALLLAACSPRQTAVHPEPLPTAAQRANDVLFRALGLVGTPYRWGGNTPESGFDCSGLVVYVFREAAGLVLPRSATTMSEIARPAVRESELRPGDLVFFRERNGRKVGHVGIYVGEGRFVHAPNEGGSVRLDRLETAYWHEHYAGARRVID